MEVYIDNRQDLIEINKELEKMLNKVVEGALLMEKKDTNYEVSISFVNNEEIRQLNKEYRGKDRETDVLSFPMDDNFIMPMPLLGDIIISTEKAREQAKDLNHSLEREIIYLTVHSIFHLLGYDHINDEDKIEMRKKEEELLEKLNVTRDYKGE